MCVKGWDHFETKSEAILRSYSLNEVLVAWLCPTLCDPMEPARLLSMEFSRQEHWGGLPFPSPGNLPDPGTEPRSPALQADSLPSEPPGKYTTLWDYPK